MEVLHELGIEWRVMVVNLAGFLVLLALLKRFAFGPIGNILAEREREVAADIEEAERAKEMALAGKRSMEEELAKLDDRAAAIIADAEKSAEQRRRELIERAEEQSQQIVAEGERSVEIATARAREQLRQETAEIAVDVSERALREALNEQRQAALVDAFIEDIERVAAERPGGDRS
ncbi:MAG: F0F1 ATP synthase subunit B [Armatimonadia bacterium]|nr:F0F1 ATP synthase subunit B [Armatimonadia bacterium]